MRGPGRIFLFAVAAFISLPLGGGRATAQTAGAETGIEGRWAGVLGGQLHLVVTITKAGSGELGGTMNSVDQHAVLALSNLTLKSNAVRFEAPRVGGVYEGKLSKDGGKLSGSWTQTGVPAQPLDFKRSAEPSAAQTPAATQQHTVKPIGLRFHAH
jgi:hypothetical protein